MPKTSVSEKVTKDVEKLLKSTHKGADAIAYRYLYAQTLETMIGKRKATLKEDVFSFLDPETSKELDRRVRAVEANQTGTSLDLFTGDVFRTCVQINAGQSYVDMEELRKALNISERRFNFAVNRATKRRAPSVIVKVFER